MIETWMGEEAGCQVRLYSFDDFIQSLALNSNHLIIVLCRFLALVYSVL